MLPLVRAVTSGRLLLHGVAFRDGPMVVPSRVHTAFLEHQRFATPWNTADSAARLQLPWERSTARDSLSSSAEFMTHVSHVKRRRTRGRSLTMTAGGNTPTSNRWCSTASESKHNSRGVPAGLAVASALRTHDAAGGAFAPAANEKGVNRQQLQSAGSNGQQGVGAGGGRPAVALGAASAGVTGEEAAVQEVWCSDRSLADACEAEPRLTPALREFEAKQPSATIIYLAYAGSRLYGTSTATSDVDIKGLYIPASDPAVQMNDTNGRDEDGGHLRLTDHPSPPPRAKKLPADFDKDFPMESKLWFSSSDSTTSNTVDDIDLELVSVDRFFAQLLRAETGALEILFSMLVPDVTLLADPQIVSLFLRDRRWMVSRDITCWVGYTYNHLSRFRKVQRQVTQRAAQKAKLNNKRRLHAETAASTVAPSGAAAEASSRSSSGAPALEKNEAPRAIGSYGTDKTEASEAVSAKDEYGAGERQALRVKSDVGRYVSNLTWTVATTGRKETRTNSVVDEREDVPLLGVISPRGENDEDEAQGEEREGWADAKRAKSGKLLSHARRAIFQAEELLKTGSITFPLKRSHVEEIRRLKAMEGAIPRKMQAIKASAVDLPDKARSSPLPLRPNREKLKALREELLDVHNNRYIQTIGER